MPRDIINPSWPPLVGRHAAFGEKFRAARLPAGLTLRHAANLTGMSMEQVSRIERGDMMPSTLDVWPLVEWMSGHIEGLKGQNKGA